MFENNRSHVSPALADPYIVYSNLRIWVLAYFWAKKKLKKSWKNKIPKIDRYIPTLVHIMQLFNAAAAM